MEESKSSGSSSNDSGSMPSRVAHALAALDAGGSKALEEYLSRIPELAPAIRQRLAALGGAGLLPTQSEPTIDGAPHRLGDFTIVRRLGGGGMGVVYVAEQGHPKRHVALKVLRTEHLFFPGARERFQREVEVLARMQHGSIVPIYSGGEDNGVPYLAMELVEGATLEEILRELANRSPAELRGSDLDAALMRATQRRQAEAAVTAPIDLGRTDPPSVTHDGAWVTTCLRVARSIANALAHAHERGVLHRDVKPSNVMLTFDGRVLLLDFGLAADAEASRLTRTGGILGSAAYMSPEQMRGDNAAIDARTDVYSLGATLYEMLTLRPAYAKDSVEATRSAVLEGRARPPREWNSSIPRDAETVCLQAMEKDRDRRYASATSFALDLDNVLDLRPIHARRASTFLRMRRTAQRHPAASVGIAAAIIIGLGGPAGYIVQQNRAQLSIQRALDQRTAALESAQQNLLFARDAIDTLLGKVANERLLAAPRMQGLRRELLDSALLAYERILENESSANTVGMDAAKTALQVGRIRREIGKSEESLPALMRAGELTRGILLARPDDEAVLDLLAEIRSEESGALQDLGRLEEALAAIDEAIAKKPGPTPTIERVRRATMLDRLDRDVDARAEFDVAEADLAPLLDQLGTDSTRAGSILHDSLFLATQRGSTAIARERFEEALSIVDAGFALKKRAGELRSVGVEIELLLIRLGSIRAHALTNLDRQPEAETQFRASIEATERVLETHPDSAEARRNIIKLHNDLGLQLVADANRGDEGFAHLDECARLMRQMLADDPKVVDPRLNFAATLVNIGGARYDRRELELARDRFVEAVELLETLRIEVPTWPGVEHFSFNALWYLGLVQRDLGAVEESVAAAKKLAVARPSDLRSKRLAAGILLNNTLKEGVSVERIAEWRSLALDYLTDAANAGSKELSILQKATDFEPLRGDPRFDAVLEAFAKNLEK